MTFNYICTRKIDNISQSFIFDLANLNKTPADVATIAAEADTVMQAIINLDNPLWDSESLVKHTVSTSNSKQDISDWKAAVDVTIVLKNYNATGKAAYYTRTVNNIATTALVTQINTFISNIGSTLSTNNFYVQSIIITEHIGG